jgi:hypothetical protein
MKKTPLRRRRADSFFGLHYDFHASKDCKDVGKNLTPAMIRELCRVVKPDYLQCDCKGHRGYTSYPTRVGNPAPGFVRDPLAIWRRVTAEEGVALYLHYSGVWDTRALELHPDWARRDEKGKRDPNNTSVFGPYADRLLIPQLKEAVDRYDVDGVWIDGDGWATAPDYSRRARAAFLKATGLKRLPVDAKDPHYEKFMDFCRQSFRAYLARYVDALHAHRPDFQVCSNWSYSAFMPEPVKTQVDFLSGDYSLQNSINTARFEGRYLAQQGVPWDLMGWSFSGRFTEGTFTTKTLPQLQQEASVVVALGGGYQTYVQQRRDASINRWMINRFGKLAKFCRARQDACWRAQPVPQVGLVLSTSWFYHRNPKLFGDWNRANAARGLLYALLDSQQVVDVVSEHHLETRMDEYPLLVLPETDYLDAAFRRRLVQYVKQGGRLLVVGSAALNLFRRELGIRKAGKLATKNRWLAYNGECDGLPVEMQPVATGPGVRHLGGIHAHNDLHGACVPAATMRRLGRGMIAAIPFQAGTSYYKGGTTVQRDFLAGVVKALVPAPMVQVSGSHLVDVTLARKEGQLVVNLVNTGGPHAADSHVYTFDEIPPVGPLTISIRLPKCPKTVRMEPEGINMAWTWQDGVATVMLARLDIHTAICVQCGK